MNENNIGASYIERARLEKAKESHSRSFADTIATAENETELLASWRAFEEHMQSLGFAEREAGTYLASLAVHHGHEVIVRRESMHRVVDALEENVPIAMQSFDQEPNAALLGNRKEGFDGISVAMAGGFGWFVDDKVAGVYGMLPDHSRLHTEGVEPGSLSETKQGSSLMKRIEGSIDPKDILFFLFRIHRSAYPAQLLNDTDYDEMTGEVNNFIVRLYAKSR